MKGQPWLDKLVRETSCLWNFIRQPFSRFLFGTVAPPLPLVHDGAVGHGRLKTEGGRRIAENLGKHHVHLKQLCVSDDPGRLPRHDLVVIRYQWNHGE